MTANVLDLTPRKVTQAERQRANREADKLVEDAEQKLKASSRERDKAAKAFADAEEHHEGVRWSHRDPTHEQRREINQAAQAVRANKAELAKADAAYIIAERERRDVNVEEADLREAPEREAQHAAEQARQQARTRLKRLTHVYCGALALAVEQRWLIGAALPSDWRPDGALDGNATFERLAALADAEDVVDVTKEINRVLPGGDFTGAPYPPVLQARAAGAAYVEHLPALAREIETLATALRS